MASLFPPGSYTLLSPAPSDTSVETSLPSLLPASAPPNAKILQISAYESIDFDYASTHSATCLVNSYVIRKALIRKHFLSATVDNWVAKHPQSVLGTHVKRSEAFEVDFAEFLDDALVEAWDLNASLGGNAVLLEDGGGGGEEEGVAEREGGDEDTGTGTGTGEVVRVGDGGGCALTGKGGKELEWWILKPSMSDRGQGIRLFCTMEQLQGIFDEWEPEFEEDEEEDGGGAAVTQGAFGDHNDESGADEEEGDLDRIMASHLRHFVAQPYIHPPLLLPELDNRKFHVRVYVLAVGSMRVYVYKEMLALFAAKPYQPPVVASAGDGEGRDRADEVEIDLDAHLTNTCLQGDDTAAKSNSVHRFWDLPLPQETADNIFEQICAVTGELFEAAARGMMIHFQPLECAFEVYGLDFLVHAAGTAWLLEVNAFPDFKQTGDLKGIVAGFWAGVLRLAVIPFVRGSEHDSGDEDHVTLGSDEMVMVKDVDLGRRWGAS